MTFLHKGFTSRQERLLRALRAAGFLPEDICALRVGDVVVQGMRAWSSGPAMHP